MVLVVGQAVVAASSAADVGRHHQLDIMLPTYYYQVYDELWHRLWHSNMCDSFVPDAPASAPKKCSCNSSEPLYVFLLL